MTLFIKVKVNGSTCHASIGTNKPHVGSSLKENKFPKQKPNDFLVAHAVATLHNTALFVLTQFLLRNFDKEVMQ